MMGMQQWHNAVSELHAGPADSSPSDKHTTPMPPSQDGKRDRQAKADGSLRAVGSSLRMSR